jgi:hypothetical protein
LYLGSRTYAAALAGDDENHVRALHHLAKRTWVAFTMTIFLSCLLTGFTRS